MISVRTRAERGVVQVKVENSLGPEACWSVWRQDDNGNRFELARNLTRKAAETTMKEFEARGHKQAYWIEPTASSPHCRP